MWARMSSGVVFSSTDDISYRFGILDAHDIALGGDGHEDSSCSIFASSSHDNLEGTAHKIASGTRASANTTGADSTTICGRVLR